MTTVKESWKKVGEDLGGIGNSIKESEIGKDVVELGKDIGKSLVTSVKHGIRAVSEWAYSDDKTNEPKPETEAESEPADTAEEAPEGNEEKSRPEIIYD